MKRMGKKKDKRRIKIALNTEKVGKEVELPSHGLKGAYASTFGQVSLAKGRRNGNKIISWDALPECNDDCIISSLCPFYLGSRLCEVMRCYVGNVVSIIHNNYHLDEPDLLRVGLHLVPLYKNLCRLKIEEYGTMHVLNKTKTGRTELNPLYGEMRKYVATIEKTWEHLGLNSIAKRKNVIHGMKGNSREMPSIGDIVNGNPGYYESLSD